MSLPNNMGLLWKNTCKINSEIKLEARQNIEIFLVNALAKYVNYFFNNIFSPQVISYTIPLGLLEAQTPPPIIPWQVGPPGPGLTWLSSRSASGVPLLAFKFEGVDHTAVLEPYDPVPEVPSESELCIFKGFLEKDPKSEVLVLGCPNSKSFDVRHTSE